MNNSHSNTNIISIRKKNFFTLILNHFFHNIPKNHNDLLNLIKSFKKNSLITQDTCNMLEGVIDIVEHRVRDIMIPRSQIVFLKKNQTWNKQYKIIIESSHSRFPVLSGHQDKVEGILIAKDLLPFMLKDLQSFNINKILRTAMVVPENKDVNSMLKDFRTQHCHMAIVIDEFGAMSGLITIEDVLELIVGEISDEYDDKHHSNIKQINKYTFSINALTTIEKFNQTFNTNFYNDEIDTIGGFIMQSFGHLPKNGESINILNYTFKVIRVDNYRIVKLIVQIPKNISDKKQN